MLLFYEDAALVIALQEPPFFSTQKRAKVMTDKEQKKHFTFRILPSEAEDLQALGAERGVTVTALLMLRIRRALVLGTLTLA